MAFKRTYHSNVIIGYKLNFLPESIKAEIPSSTAHNWKHKNMTQLFGYEWAVDIDDELQTLQKIAQHKKLIKIAKALLFIIETYKILLTEPKFRRVLKESKHIVAECIDRVKEVFGIKRSVGLFGITSQQYYRWKQINKVCHYSSFNECIKGNPQQLTLNEVQAIKKYCTDSNYAHWSLATVYWKMIRDKAALMGKSTFYKYTTILDLRKFRSKVKGRKSVVGIRATKPLEILHMDVTIFKTSDNTKVFIYFIQDNFSRAILGWKAALSCNSEIACQNLKEVCSKFNLYRKHVRLVTDDGSENEGAVNSFLLKPEVKIEKQIALKDIIYSNSMVESVNRVVKYQFLFRKPIACFVELITHLTIAVDDFNGRPHDVLFGNIPLEVLNGKSINKKQYTQSIQKSKRNRVEVNQKTGCGLC